MQNTTTLPLPGAGDEPEVQAAIADALAEMAIWCHAIEIWIRAHLLQPKHAPNIPCIVCLAWKRRPPSFPHAQDELLSRLQADDAIAFIRGVYVFPQALKGCRRLCLWRAWANGGGKVLIVDPVHLAALPGIKKGAAATGPAPGSPTLVAYRAANGQTSTALCVDGHALDGVAATKFHDSGHDYTFAADSAYRGPWAPRALLLGVIGRTPRDHPKSSAEEAALENATSALKKNRGEIAIQQAKIAFNATSIGTGSAYLEGRPIAEGYPPPDAEDPELIHLATIVQMLSSPLKPGIQRLEDADPGLDALLRSGGVALRPIPPRFQVPDGPRLFPIPAWNSPPKHA